MLNIPGTKANPLNSQLLVSSGVPTLDNLLGGGLPVGSIILIEEDTLGVFAKTLLKYFIVEGIASSQDTLMVSLDAEFSEILETLPALSMSQSSQVALPKMAAHEDRMKIAFRYQSLPTSEKEVQSAFGHYYDLSQNMPADQIDATKHRVISFADDEETHTQGATRNRYFNSILNKVCQTTKDVKFCIDDKLDQKSILRVAISQLGTLLWENLEELPKFMYLLRCILRNSFAISMITVPTHLSSKLKQMYDGRLLNICDVALRLVAFSGTHYERNKALSEFHGFFHVDKCAPINSLLSSHPEAVEYTFKLIRRKFLIEKLHLPAGIDLDPKEGESQRKTPMGGCGSSGMKSFLDF